jgi:hypothetical protein
MTCKDFWTLSMVEIQRLEFYTYMDLFTWVHDAYNKAKQHVLASVVVRRLNLPKFQ